MKDALIIGQGIAGTVLSHELHTRGWNIDVADEFRPLTASKIASGLYNPLVLKRRRVVWKAHEMLDILPRVYESMETLTNASFLLTTPVWEVLPDPGTENDWAALTDHPNFEPFIGEIRNQPNESIIAPRVGEVSKSGKVHVADMIEAWSAYLKSKDSKINAFIHENEIAYNGEFWKYGDKSYRHVIWCDGYKPESKFFPGLPFSPTKGEVMVVHSPQLQLDHILHGNVFIMPLGDDTYKVGATYSWKELDTIPTEAGLEQLKEGWNKLVNAPYEIIEHTAGIRPNVKDRKPLIGTSTQNEQMHLFNGLGSRGILMAPWLAAMFADYLENKGELLPEIDVRRFTSPRA